MLAGDGCFLLSRRCTTPVVTLIENPDDSIMEPDSLGALCEAMLVKLGCGDAGLAGSLDLASWGKTRAR